MKDWVVARVRDYYWRDDINCATTMLKILAEATGVVVHQDVIKAAVGMHGAGGYGAQCGLVEGGLMFIGIAGDSAGMPENQIIAICKDYAAAFSETFHSLLCSKLRPEGFGPQNPPHLCEKFTVAAALCAIEFIRDKGIADLKGT